MGRYKSYLTGVQNEGGGIKATFGQYPKEKHFFYGFPYLDLDWDIQHTSLYINKTGI